MQTSSIPVFIAFALVPLPATAKDDALQTLEYAFASGRDDRQTLEKMQSEIEAKLKVVDIEEFKGGEDCVKLGKKGSKRDTVAYVCSTDKKVYDVMTSVYYSNLDANSPVNDISANVSPTATSCSVGGCKYSGHLHAQPCIYVTDNGVWCRHSPYTSAHNCYP
jgi:hypothetical protein